MLYSLTIYISLDSFKNIWNYISWVWFCFKLQETNGLYKTKQNRTKVNVIICSI